MCWGPPLATPCAGGPLGSRTAGTTCVMFLFVFLNTKRKEKKEKGSGGETRQRSCQKPHKHKPQTLFVWGNIVQSRRREGGGTDAIVSKVIWHFFCRTLRRNIEIFHSLPLFPKHVKLNDSRFPSPVVLPPPHPPPPCPPPWLICPLDPWTLTPAVWREGIKPACRYYPSLSALHSSLRRVLCRWRVNPERPEMFFALTSFLSFPFISFGCLVRAQLWNWSEETLSWERTPHVLVWFVVSILMRWNSSSCRIFCIARIVRRWEDRGAIWKEFSYSMVPQQTAHRVSYNIDTYKYI